MFWDNFYHLCELRNTTPNAVCKELNLSTATATHWKNGTMPKGDVLFNLANLLDCSVDYLLGRVDEPDKYLKITYPIDPTEKGIKLSSSNSKPKNNTQFDETTTQVAEMFSKLNLVDKTKVLSLMVELSQAQTKEEPSKTIKISANDGKPPKVVTKETLDKIAKATDITDNY